MNPALWISATFLTKIIFTSYRICSEHFLFRTFLYLGVNQLTGQKFKAYNALAVFVNFVWQQAWGSVREHFWHEKFKRLQLLLHWKKLLEKTVIQSVCSHSEFLKAFRTTTFTTKETNLITLVMTIRNKFWSQCSVEG